MVSILLRPPSPSLTISTRPSGAICVPSFALHSQHLFLVVVADQVPLYGALGTMSGHSPTKGSPESFPLTLHLRHK